MGRQRTREGKLLLFCAAGLIFSLSWGCTTLKKEFTWSSSQGSSPVEVSQKPEPAKPPDDEALRAKALVNHRDLAGSPKKNQESFSQSDPKDARDQVLFNTGLVYAHVGNPQRDFGKALHFFKVLLKEYPQSPLAREAEVLIGVLQENKKLSQAVQKIRQENKELSQVIEKSKQVDMEVEDKKREKVK